MARGAAEHEGRHLSSTFHRHALRLFDTPTGLHAREGTDSARPVSSAGVPARGQTGPHATSPRTGTGVRTNPGHECGVQRGQPRSASVASTPKTVRLPPRPGRCRRFRVAVSRSPFRPRGCWNALHRSRAGLLAAGEHGIATAVGDTLRQALGHPPPLSGGASRWPHCCRAAFRAGPSAGQRPQLLSARITRALWRADTPLARAQQGPRCSGKPGTSRPSPARHGPCRNRARAGSAHTGTLHLGSVFRPTAARRVRWP